MKLFPFVKEKDYNTLLLEFLNLKHQWVLLTLEFNKLKEETK